MLWVYPHAIDLSKEWQTTTISPGLSESWIAKLQRNSAKPRPDQTTDTEKHNIRRRGQPNNTFSVVWLGKSEAGGLPIQRGLKPYAVVTAQSGEAPVRIESTR